MDVTWRELKCVQGTGQQLQFEMKINQRQVEANSSPKREGGRGGGRRKDRIRETEREIEKQ